MDKRVAILATDGFEQAELFQPLQALQGHGATVHIISDRRGKIRAWDRTDWGKGIPVDKTVDAAHALDYDALVLPGGAMNLDRLRGQIIAVNFVKAFFERGKVVAAMGQAPWLLIKADFIEGRRLTSHEGIREEVIQAGGLWVDAATVVDNGLLTGRNPEDLPAFTQRLVQLVQEGRPGEQHDRSPFP